MFEERLEKLKKEHEKLIQKKNKPCKNHNGIYQRYNRPVVTAAHAPLHWRFDLNKETNPLLLERIGVNAAFNAGAMKWKGKYLLMLRMEGWDRKSYFAVA